ncbi:MAG: hypothetical protein RLY93_04585 [Sumerlaeia bacterium]
MTPAQFRRPLLAHFLLGLLFLAPLPAGGQSWVVAGLEDPDGDGLSSRLEERLGLDPGLDDSDGDGILDGDEDSDEDGLTNLEELALGLDPGEPDTDGDRVPDGEEIDRGLDPLAYDSDSDGFSDGEETEDGSDPLLAQSVPIFNDVLVFSIQNATGQFADNASFTFSLANEVHPASALGRIDGPCFTIENTPPSEDKSR